MNALSIAGTDPSGGAGIQADLKTFSALGVYGAAVITSLVAQNTCGVQSIYPVEADFVAAQLESVLSDVHIDSAKIGMIGQESVIFAVAAKLREYSIPWLVLDTVMISKSGDTLLDENIINNFRNYLIPIASIITPNLIEAATLLGCQPANDEYQMRQQGRALLSLGCQAVVMKGGHLKGDTSPDWLITVKDEVRFDNTRVTTQHTHGTGCTLSAALTALRPFYRDWSETLQVVKPWLQQTLLNADDLHVGQGNGPVHHFHEWW